MNVPHGSHADICASVSQLRATLPGPERAPRTVKEVLAALGEFMECVRYLNTRRSQGAILNLASEADVQDAVYIMLRPWIPDLRCENPTDKVGNRYVIKDFVIPSTRTVIEIKYVRDKTHGKNISQELHDDIEMYSRHEYCDDLIFFLYDADSLIPDVRALTNSIAGRQRVFDGKTLRTHLLVRP